MIQYISEFGLPKEFSKKKKFDLLIGMFIPKEEWKDQQIDWNINMDLQAVYLTIEDCSRNVIDTLLNNGKTADEQQRCVLPKALHKKQRYKKYGIDNGGGR